MMFGRWALVVGVATFLLAPQAAFGTTVEYEEDDRFGETYIWVYGTDGKNKISIEPIRGGFVVSDPRSRVSGPEDDCDQLSRHRLACDIQWVSGIYAKGGKDTVRMRKGTDFVYEVGGGPGNDRLLGGPGTDRLTGGIGDDLVRGAAGDDRLGKVYIGEDPGVDVFLGGPGGDKIHAVDKRRDETIDCGGGRGDRAKVDRRKDPRAVGCESVAKH